MQARAENYRNSRNSHVYLKKISFASSPKLCFETDNYQILSMQLVCRVTTTAKSGRFEQVKKQEPQDYYDET